MGSLKRKSASLPSSSSSSSSKRASRGDALPASGNGYALRRTNTNNHTDSRPASDPSANGTPPRAARPARDARASGSSGLPPSSSLPHDDGTREEEEEEEEEDQQQQPQQLQEQQQQQGTVVAEQDSPNAGDRSGCEDDTDHGCAEDESAENLGPLVPNHAGWFLWDKIHEIERRGLPEFFNSKSKLKTPSLYMEYRNLLMRKYLENQDNLFTWAEASSMALPEEIKEGFKEAAKGIFEFLDHWGLINSKAIRNAKAGVVKQKCALEPSKGPLLPSLYRFDKMDACSTSRPSTAAEKPTIATNLADTAIADLQGGIEGPGVDYHCNSCSADCSKRRFHCQKQADFDLCPECYSEEKFSFGITTTDFILMEAVADADDTSSGGWSDQETLLLLEALELYGDNFNEIADHVATKTKAQCILHFIRLPIEDPFLEGSDLSANLSNLQPVPDKAASLACPSDDQDAGLKNHVSELACEKAPEDETLVLEGSKNGELVEDGKNGNKEDKASVATAIILAAAQTAGLCGPEKSIAFSGCGNPVMALVSFLAALVEPDVVMRSAEVAVKILSEHASASQLAEKNSYRLEMDLLKNETIKAPQDGALEEGVPTESDSAKTTLIPCEDSITCGDEGKSSFDDSTAKVSTLSSTERIKNAASTALAAAAVKAKFLADREEWEVLRLAASVVDNQCKKVETKMKLLKDLDATLQREHNSLERSRQRLYAERIQMAKSRGIPGTSSGQLLGINTALPTGGQKFTHGYAGVHPAVCMVPRAVTPSVPTDMLRSNVFTQGPSSVLARPPLTHMPNFAHPSELQRFTQGPA